MDAICQEKCKRGGNVLPKLRNRTELHGVTTNKVVFFKCEFFFLGGGEEEGEGLNANVYDGSSFFASCCVVESKYKATVSFYDRKN
jgi:hypothetical protein